MLITEPYVLQGNVRLSVEEWKDQNPEPSQFEIDELRSAALSVALEQGKARQAARENIASILGVSLTELNLAFS